MSKEFRRDSLNMEIDKLREQYDLLKSLDLLMEKQKDRNLSVSEQMRNQTKILETRLKLEQQGIKNLQTQQDIDKKAEELDRRIMICDDERLRLIESITREKEKQGRVDAENAKKARTERDAQLKSDVERIKNHNKISELEEKRLHREKAIARAYKDKTDAEKQEIINNDTKLKQLEREIELENKRRQREERTKQGYNKAIDSINIPGVGSVGSLKEFSEMKLGAQLFTVAVDTFNKAVETFTGLFTGGMNRVYTNANNQFTNIATRTGMSYGTYRDGIAGMGGNLKNWGGYDLQDNLKTSDVQNMMNSLASNGFSQENLMSAAVENAITNTIVPYLDTTSTEFNLLNSRLDGEFVKNIRGINKANLEIAGSNVMTESILNKMVSLIQPMSDEAIDNLASNSAEVTAMANKLVKDYGWSQAAAEEYAMSSFKFMKYGANDLSNATTSDLIKYSTIMQSGLNVSDLDDAAAIAGISLDVDQNLMGYTNGYGSTSDTLSTNTIMGNFGVSWENAQNILKLNKKGVTGSQIADMVDVSEEELKRLGLLATEEYANGDYQTAAQKQETYMENISTELAMIKTDVGYWFDTLTTAVQGIAKILLAWGVGKLMGLGGRRLWG